jgi:F0F1-type ATP synthase assembly protein I
MADEGQNRKDNAAVIWARYSQIAFIIPAAVVIGLFVGKLLDYWLHTRWRFLVGLIIGAVAGFVDVIRTVIKNSN